MLTTTIWGTLDDEKCRAAAERRKLNSQAVGNARKKAKRADKSGEPVHESLAVRTLLAGLYLGPLGVGPERAKKQKAHLQEVCRAEQTAQERDALNAWQKAYKQVIMHTCALGYLEYFPQPKSISSHLLMALAVQSSGGAQTRRQHS